ncbi:hypothetical protein M758_12G029700 [Ceratodon purpureus]|nr:hypothetical protein M758_12G029500 [Ceratodon purpureus]KAG0597905.1 hypothetical protein M758_12G029700 [Ceratodon purpureus]
MALKPAIVSRNQINDHAPQRHFTLLTMLNHRPNATLSLPAPLIRKTPWTTLHHNAQTSQALPTNALTSTNQLDTTTTNPPQIRPTSRASIYLLHQSTTPSPQPRKLCRPHSVHVLTTARTQVTCQH